MTMFLLICKCGKKHYFMGRNKQHLLSGNHLIYKKQKRKIEFKMKDIEDFVKMWNRANPEHEL